jgi:hypothetical protein
LGGGEGWWRWRVCVTMVETTTPKQMKYSVQTRSHAGRLSHLITSQITGCD